MFWVEPNLFPNKYSNIFKLSYPSYLSAYEDGTECSETSAYKIQTPENYPEESIQYSEQGESLKSRKLAKLRLKQGTRFTYNIQWILHLHQFVRMLQQMCCCNCDQLSQMLLILYVGVKQNVSEIQQELQMEITFSAISKQSLDFYCR